MKKKTKSKSKNSFSFLFALSILILFACAGYALYLFYNNFFRSLSKMNEDPIATISFKYKTAQRKFSGKNVWDRLRSGSPIYNGDTIHTADLSEATIYFSDGNVMDLAENTMAQVFVNEEGLVADLTGGSAVFDSSEAGSGVTINSGGMKVQVEAGSSLSAGVSAGGENQNQTANFQVLKGTASVFTSSSDGKNADEEVSVQKMSAGENMSVSFTEGETPAKITIPPMSIISPVQNQRYLYHHKGNYQVKFAWKFRDAENDENAVKDVQDVKHTITLVVAADKNFKKIIERSVIKNAESYTVPLAPQTYYWKIDGAENFSQTGKIQISQSLAPSLVSPVQDYTYYYRSKNPTVRLIWDEAPFSTSYKLEVAKDSSFEQPLITQTGQTESSVISTLPDGKYFWRVTPFYTINKVGYAAQSEIGKFSIEKQDSVMPPTLLSPVEMGVMNVDKNVGAISFSWKNDPDVNSYDIVISDNPSLSSPLVNATVSENFYKIDTKSVSLPEGKIYWGVRSRDSEGGVSPFSQVRMVYTIKGKLEQSILEPVDGYRASEIALPKTQFTWKKHLTDNFDSEIEIATDSHFTNIVSRTKVQSDATSMNIPRLPVGQYYWHLKSTETFTENNASDSKIENAVNERKANVQPIVLVTSPKQFLVVEKLAPVKITEPKDMITVHKNARADFKWNKLQGADEYTFSILSSDGKTVLVNRTVKETQVSLDLFSDLKFDDKKNYTVQIEANADAVPGVSSELTGEVARKTFGLKKIYPVEITYPREGMQFNGANAVLSPPVLTWSSTETLREAQVVLQKVEKNRTQEVMRYPSNREFRSGKKVAPSTVTLNIGQGLPEGTYRVEIYAKTRDGVDVSANAAKDVRTFSVLPIQNLVAPANLRATPALFGADYLRNVNNPRIVTLEWGKVVDATEYQLEIFKGAKNPRAKKMVSAVLKETKYSIDFMKLNDADRLAFSNGTFTYTVKAVRKYDSNGDGRLDKVLQEGEVSSASFITDVPIPRATKTKGAVNPYGQ
ncbi:MAG: FecR domain-containing protein [Treponema sp.]|nr:FecR domain-containing protein [Treponema sp.]